MATKGKKQQFKLNKTCTLQNPPKGNWREPGSLPGWQAYGEKPEEFSYYVRNQRNPRNGRGWQLDRDGKAVHSEVERQKWSFKKNDFPLHLDRSMVMHSCPWRRWSTFQEISNWEERWTKSIIGRNMFNSTGPDNMHSRVIKKSAEEVSGLLILILGINLVLQKMSWLEECYVSEKKLSKMIRMICAG